MFYLQSDKGTDSRVSGCSSQMYCRGIQAAVTGRGRGRGVGGRWRERQRRRERNRNTKTLRRKKRVRKSKLTTRQKTSSIIDVGLKSGRNTQKE